MPRLKPSEFTRASRARFHAEASFYMDVERTFFEGMRKFLKDELGVRSLLVGSSDHRHALDGVSGYPHIQFLLLFDLLDGHGYWQHPTWEKLTSTANRNRLLDRVRRYQQALAREQLLPEGNGQELAADCQPRPSEVVQAQELWERMLLLCPPAHRELLRLKRDGLSLEEIAARTGLHPGSIRRILYDLTRRLATRSPAPSPSGTAPVGARIQAPVKVPGA